jgi:hypothetical protein
MGGHEKKKSVEPVSNTQGKQGVKMGVLYWTRYANTLGYRSINQSFKEGPFV